MKTVFACLLVTFSIFHASSVLAQNSMQPVHNIILTEARDIADAAPVNRAVNVVVKDVESCNPPPQDAHACACSFKIDLEKLKAAYNAAVAKHPAWKAQATVVSYVDPATSKSVTLDFLNLKRQFDSCSKDATKAK